MSLPNSAFNKIYVASDHAGFQLKEFLIHKFPDWPIEDLGPMSEDRVDYPDYVNKVCEKLQSPTDMGLLLCGSGQGMAMRANKYSHVRAALCWDIESTKLSRQHNAANVLCLGSRLLDFELCATLLDVFVETDFEGGRHSARVEKIGAKT